MPVLLLFVFTAVFFATGTFSILSLLAVLLFPLATVFTLRGNISKKNIFITTVLDILLVLLILWKGLYLFTPFFGIPEGLFMDLSNGEIVYCGCVFLFPAYLSIFFLVSLLTIIGLKYYHIRKISQGKMNNTLNKMLILWSVILILFSLVQSSIYGKYFPYGSYKPHTVENFDKNRNIVIDTWKNLSE